jgi:hypothetical protein
MKLKRELGGAPLVQAKYQERKPVVRDNNISKVKGKVVSVFFN